MNKAIPFAFFMFCLLLRGVLYSGNVSESVSGDSIPEYRLSEIVVLGDRLPGSGLLSVYEINHKRIELLDARNARQALSYVSGLYFSRSTKNENTFRLRGFEQRQVNVFLDGVPISAPYDGLMDISQLAGDNFEDIRVSKGLSSILYGANTLGGAVNIITSLPAQGFSYKFRTEGSDQGKIFGDLLVKGSLSRLRFSASLAYENAPDFRLPNDSPIMLNEDGGKRNNSDYRKTSATVKLHYAPAASHRIGAHFSFIDNRMNVPPNALVQRPRYWQFPEWQKNVISLNSEHIISKNFIIRSIWFYDAYRNTLQSYDDDRYSTQTRGYAFTSIYDDYTLGGIIYPEFSWTSLGITRGIISYKQDVHRQKDGESLPFERYSAGILTAGAEQELFLSKRWRALAGIDGNYLKPLAAFGISLRDPIFLINGQFSLRYLSLSKWEVHASLGRKTRFPTLKELYSERLGRNIANPDLAHEKSLNFELGFRWSDEQGETGINLFQHYLTDYIVNVQIGQGTQQYQNIGKVLSRGYEIDMRRQWKSFDLMANYTYLQVRNRTANRTSPYLEYRPAHQINVVLAFTPLQPILLGFEAGYFADQYYQNPDDLRWGKLNDYGLLNIKSQLNIKNSLAVYIRINNLLDEFYYSEYGIPMPGREFFLGLKIDG